MKIISWNLLHTGGASIEQVRVLIACHRPDVMLMQEATSSMDSLPETMGGYYARVPLPGSRHGLAAWTTLSVRRPATSFALQRGILVRRVAQILTLRECTLVNVHLSHGQLLNRFQLWQIATALRGRSAILGDCNLLGAAWLPGFADVGPKRPTHRSANLVPVRIDRCFIHGLRCTATEVLQTHGSDHQAIMVELADPC